MTSESGVGKGYQSITLEIVVNSGKKGKVDLNECSATSTVQDKGKVNSMHT